jgi:hypothetical protein
MAHFAKLDENNVVLEVNSVSNHELVTTKNTVEENGNVICYIVESEDKGIAFLTSWSGGYANWKQTSYNATFRGKFAGVGDTFDVENNVFVAPIVEYVEVTSPVVESAIVVEALQTTEIAALTSSDIQELSSVDISALNTSDLQSLTTTGL